MSIKMWPASEQPREKLLQQGAKALSDAELLAIVLRTGTVGHSAVDLARMLLMRFGCLSNVLHASLLDLGQQKGIGQAAYLQFQAILHLSERVLKEDIESGEFLHNSQAVADYLRLRMGHLSHECLLVIYLNSQHQVITMEELCSGGLSEQHVSPRLLVGEALKQQAAALVFVHNHPGGLPVFSKEDCVFTQKMDEILAPLDIVVLDHFLIAKDKMVSLSMQNTTAGNKKTIA